MNPEVHGSSWTKFFSGYMPRSGIAESYGHPIFGLLGNLDTLLQSGCTSLHSHQQYKRLGRTLSWLSSIPVTPSSLACFWLCGCMIQSPCPVTKTSFLSEPPLRFAWGPRSFSSGPALIQCDLIVTWLHPTHDTGGKWKKQTHFQVSLHSPAHRLGSECITWGRPSLTHSALFFSGFSLFG